MRSVQEALTSRRTVVAVTHLQRASASRRPRLTRPHSESAKTSWGRHSRKMGRRPQRGHDLRRE